MMRQPVYTTSTTELKTHWPVALSLTWLQLKVKDAFKTVLSVTELQGLLNPKPPKCQNK